MNRVLLRDRAEQASAPSTALLAAGPLRLLVHVLLVLHSSSSSTADLFVYT